MIDARKLLRAYRICCDVITVMPDLLGKVGPIGKDLDEFSLETVRMFHHDSAAGRYTL